MPHNTEEKAATPATGYKARLNSWAIARLAPDTEREIVARFRSRSDAEGYMQHLTQTTPNAAFMVVFDCQREAAVI
jgi:hypothetical protein